MKKRIRQLLDRHVIARDVVTLVEPLNIFDDIAIEERREEKAASDASVADTIAHQLTLRLKRNGMKIQSSSEVLKSLCATQSQTSTKGGSAT